MKLDIKLMDNFEHNCFDGLIASVAKWNNVPYSFAYAEAWDFTADYEMRGDMVFSTLRVPNTLNKEILKDYCGVSINYIQFNKNRERLMTTLKEELSHQRPVIIVLDYYWCPWREEVSSIVHRENHASLVVGYDELGLICLDYSPKYENGILPYKNIINIDAYVTINIDAATRTNYDEVISRSINLIKSHDIFNEMRKFANHIEDSFDPQKYLDQVENHAWFPNVFQISLIAEGRCIYARALRAISNKNESEALITIAEKLEATKAMWKNIELLLIKTYRNKSLSSKKNLAKKIYQLADLEEDIYRSLVSLNEVAKDNG